MTNSLIIDNLVAQRDLARKSMQAVKPGSKDAQYFGGMVDGLNIAIRLLQSVKQ
jgi:hypothetical protein